MSHQDRRDPLPRHYRFGDAATMLIFPGHVVERWIVRANAEIEDWKRTMADIKRKIVETTSTHV